MALDPSEDDNVALRLHIPDAKCMILGHGQQEIRVLGDRELRSNIIILQPNFTMLLKIQMYYLYLYLHYLRMEFQFVDGISMS